MQTQPVFVSPLLHSSASGVDKRWQHVPLNWKYIGRSMKGLRRRLVELEQMLRYANVDKMQAVKNYRKREAQKT